MDVVWFETIHGFAHQYKWLDQLGIFFAIYFQYLLIAILALAFFYPSQRRRVRRRMILASIVAAAIARLIIKPVIVFFFYRIRPPEILSQVQPLVSLWDNPENLASFPSGHAITFFAIATAIYCFDRPWGYLFFASAFVIGLARIFVGVHWPTDVLGGALIGILIGWGISRFFQDKAKHLL